MTSIEKFSNSFPEIKKIVFFEHLDDRGSFTKLYSKQIFEQLGFIVNEVFYSTSKKNVFRGFHMQADPYEIKKIVFCSEGKIEDFFIDLRKGSSNFGKFEKIILSKENNTGLYIPEGFGHGFRVLSDYATVGYLQEGYHNIDSETGVNPMSLDQNFGNVVISLKDKNLPSLEQFANE